VGCPTAAGLTSRRRLWALGKEVHVSGHLIGKIEKAERHPQPDLGERLDTALQADGHIRDLGTNSVAARRPVSRG